MRVVSLVLLSLCGCTGYYANLARGFSAVVLSPSADLAPMVRGIGELCRRQGDLVYLRHRLEAEDEVVPWSQRRRARYAGRTQSIDAACGKVDDRARAYLLMLRALTSYAAGLRSLSDSQGTDYQDSFRTAGTSLALLGRQLMPLEPEMSRVMISGADAINQVLALSLALRTEADIRRAVLAAEGPVTQLITALGRALVVYEDEVRRYLALQEEVLAQVERDSRRRGAELLSLYALARQMDEEETRLRKGAEGYAVALRGVRVSHETLVSAARRRVPLKEAVRLMQRSLRVLVYDLNDIYYSIDQMYRRRQP